MIQQQAIAYYTATKKIKFLTVYSDEQRTKEIKTIEVSGKMAAKKYCKENSIRSWNF